MRISRRSLDELWQAFGGREVPKAAEPPNPVAWAEAVTGRPLDPWQRAVLVSPHRDILLNCSRQTGKSEVSSLRAAFRALFLQRRAVVLAPTARQSGVSTGGRSGGSWRPGPSWRATRRPSSSCRAAAAWQHSPATVRT